MTFSYNYIYGATRGRLSLSYGKLALWSLAYLQYCTRKCRQITYHFYSILRTSKVLKRTVELKEVRRVFTGLRFSTLINIFRTVSVLFFYNFFRIYLISSTETPRFKVQIQPFFQPLHKVSGFINKMSLWKSLCESDSIKVFVNVSTSKIMIMIFL
jgi:hypothetical protein